LRYEASSRAVRHSEAHCSFSSASACTDGCMGARDGATSDDSRIYKYKHKHMHTHTHTHTHIHKHTHRRPRSRTYTCRFVHMRTPTHSCPPWKT